MLLSNGSKFPNSPLMPTALDQGDYGAKALLASTGGMGGCIVLAGQPYRAPIEGVPVNVVPTLAVHSPGVINLTSVVYVPGREWRLQDGTILTTLELAANMVHFVALQSFVNSAASPLFTALAAPWKSLAVPA